MCRSKEVVENQSPLEKGREAHGTEEKRSDHPTGGGGMLGMVESTMAI
jgi:hypothetical protein